jgi:hypothetical protein
MAPVRRLAARVTLITGCLGSGKTTLLQRLLRDPALSDTAVLINEFGEIGLDHHLLERHRRDDGDAAVGLRLLHDPRRTFGCYQGPAFAARTRPLAAFPAPDHRKHRPGRSLPDLVDGAVRSGAAASFLSRQCNHNRRCGERRAAARRATGSGFDLLDEFRPAVEDWQDFVLIGWGRRTP